MQRLTICQIFVFPPFLSAPPYLVRDSTIIYERNDAREVLQGFGNHCTKEYMYVYVHSSQVDAIPGFDS